MPDGSRPHAGVLAAGLVLWACSACAGGSSEGREAGTSGAPPNPFAAHSLWDDGRAEVNAYEALQRRYGALRPFTAYHIVVKEDFSRAQLVKADPGHDPDDLVTVIKMNQVLEFQTGIYSYHQMASTFFDRSTMDLLKFSLTSFEWCGNTYKEYTRRDGKARLHVHTYWDNQAEATYDLPVGPDVVFYDQVPLWVRSLPQTAGTVRALRLIPSQIHSQGSRPEVRSAVLRASGEETIESPAGTFPALRWELKVEGEPPDLFWTAREFPHLLVAWDKPDGGRYRLMWTQRLAYWMLNRPGDEKHLARPGKPKV
jgi:hypothetical protein